MASFKAKFPVLQELFAKNHRGGPLAPPPSGARVKTLSQLINRLFHIAGGLNESGSRRRRSALISFRSSVEL